MRKETRCHHIGYSFWLTARVILYAPSHRQDSTYHGLCYTSRGALAGTRNSSMGSPHEGSIRWPIAPWANILTMELHLVPGMRKEGNIFNIFYDSSQLLLFLFFIKQRQFTRLCSTHTGFIWQSNKNYLYSCGFCINQLRFMFDNLS